MQKPVYCLALDQGSFSSRALLFNQQGAVISSAQQSIRLNQIDQQHIEQDASELLNSVVSVMHHVLDQNIPITHQIMAAGLATQRSSIVAWRPSTGEAISPVISWQDTRAADWLNTFTTHTSRIESITRLRLSPHYGVSKIHWLLTQSIAVKNAVQNGDCIISPLASFLLFHLCNEKIISIDSANASRMLLLNLLTQSWDDSLLELFSIPRNILPQCHPISRFHGTIKNTSIPFLALNGDQNSALYQAGLPDHSALQINLGTGAFVLTPVQSDLILTAEFQHSGLLAGISNSQQDTADFYIEGTVNGAGCSLHWLQQQFPSLQTISDFNCVDFSKLTPPIFINTIGGVGSPIWRSDIEPFFIDFEVNEKNYPLAMMAVVESILFLLMLNIERINTLKRCITHINISGGLSNNHYLCQSLANLSMLEVHLSEGTEATARGIAWLALQQLGEHQHCWKPDLPEKSWSPQPNPLLFARYAQFKQHFSSLFRFS